MSRRCLIVMGCIVGVLCACSNKDDAPSGILPREKMESVLWDIIQAERYTSTYMAMDTSKNIKLENFKLYDQIFQIHGINKDEFIESYRFYLSRPDIARVLFDSITARSNREREDLYKPKPQADTAKTEQPKADSAGAVKPPSDKKDTVKAPHPAPPTQPVPAPVKNPVRVKRDSTRPLLVPDSIKRTLLKPKNHLLRPGMFNRDSVLRSRQ
jgi:hypothetical protein